jgi:6-phosphogluconolactonase/glucosamine-6-phosphate isomerase/deaminase
MTLTLLNCSRAVVVLVSGSDKSAIVRQVLRRTSAEPLPAHLLQPDGDVVWMLDRDAASGLLEVS